MEFEYLSDFRELILKWVVVSNIHVVITCIVYCLR